jgi:hypothetical protein
MIGEDFSQEVQDRDFSGTPIPAIPGVVFNTKRNITVVAFPLQDHCSNARLPTRTGRQPKPHNIANLFMITEPKKRHSTRPPGGDDAGANYQSTLQLARLAGLAGRVPMDLAAPDRAVRVAIRCQAARARDLRRRFWRLLCLLHVFGLGIECKAGDYTPAASAGDYPCVGETGLRHALRLGEGRAKCQHGRRKRQGWLPPAPERKSANEHRF